MNFATNVKAYQQNFNLLILDAKPHELLDKVFEEIYITLKSTESLFKENLIEPARLSIDRCIGLIHNGLIDFLDIQYDIGKQLLATYNIMVAHLVNANRTQSLDSIEICIKMTSELRETFKLAALQQQTANEK